jgi:hypothetical protein
MLLGKVNLLFLINPEGFAIGKYIILAALK